MIGLDWIRWFKKTINLELNATQDYYFFFKPNLTSYGNQLKALCWVTSDRSCCVGIFGLEGFFNSRNNSQKIPI